MKTENHTQKRFTTGQFLGAIAALLLGLVAVAYAVTLPNTFTSGTSISSSQVNANFSALKVAVDALEAKVNPSGITTRIVAMGRVNGSSITQTTPVFGNLTMNVNGTGEVSFSFDGYSMPDDKHDYVTQVQASFVTSVTSDKNQPTVNLAAYSSSGPVYKVLRGNTGLTISELFTMEFQVNVSIVESK